MELHERPYFWHQCRTSGCPGFIRVAPELQWTRVECADCNTAYEVGCDQTWADPTERLCSWIEGNSDPTPRYACEWASACGLLPLEEELIWIDEDGDRDCWPPEVGRDRLLAHVQREADRDRLPCVWLRVAPGEPDPPIVGFWPIVGCDPLIDARWGLCRPRIQVTGWEPCEEAP